jgi:hypothetical protein
MLADDELIETVGTVQRKDLGTFVVGVDRVLQISKLSDKKYAARVKRMAENRMLFGQSALINPTTVDEVTYSKSGITSAIEYNKPPYFGRPCR